jgi:hypothetical protein
VTIELRQARARRRSSWVLLLALLPLLTFMGHWPASVPIPGTDSYLSIPLAGAETHDEENETHNHSQHCHAGAASCSDAPAAAGVTIAFGANGFAIATASGLLLLALSLSWRPASIRSLLPDPRPPKFWTSA